MKTKNFNPRHAISRHLELLELLHPNWLSLPERVSSQRLNMGGWECGFLLRLLSRCWRQVRKRKTANFTGTKLIAMMGCQLSATEIRLIGMMGLCRSATVIRPIIAMAQVLRGMETVRTIVMVRRLRHTETQPILVTDARASGSAIRFTAIDLMEGASRSFGTRRARRPQGRREGGGSNAYLFRSLSMVSQASSASASVLKGEPPILMALVF